MGRPPESDGDTMLWLLNGIIFDLAKIRAIAETATTQPPNVIAMLDALNTIEALALRAQSDAQTAEEIRKRHSARSIAARMREAGKRSNLD